MSKLNLQTGNHDVTLDPSFYAQHGTRFHNQHLEDPQKCIEVLRESPDPSIVYLCHEPAVIRLTRPEGPNTVFKVFGSPYSPSSSSGSSSKWAFGYETTGDDDAAVLWDQIPLDTDLVVSHTPPHSHCDRRMTGGPVGCQRLRQVLHRVRPKLAVCGHVHESRGYERVRWSSSSSSASGETETEGQVIIEEERERGVLPHPGSKKQSLVDLTGKTTRRLDNAWSSSDRDWTMGVSSCTNSTITRTGNPQMTTTGQEGHDNGGHAIRARRREETCIINAAVMATSWPHRGGKRFNTPIVVDLECPVWNNYRRK